MTLPTPRPAVALPGGTATEHLLLPAEDPATIPRKTAMANLAAQIRAFGMRCQNIPRPR